MDVGGAQLVAVGVARQQPRPRGGSRRGGEGEEDTLGWKTDGSREVDQPIGRMKAVLLFDISHCARHHNPGDGAHGWERPLTGHRTRRTNAVGAEGTHTHPAPFPTLHRLVGRVCGGREGA